MTRRPPIIRQSDVTRMLKGALAAGVDVKTIRIDANGTIILATDKEQQCEDLSAYKEWKANNG